MKNLNLLATLKSFFFLVAVLSFPAAFYLQNMSTRYLTTTIDLLTNSQTNLLEVNKALIARIEALEQQNLAARMASVEIGQASASRVIFTTAVNQAAVYQALHTALHKDQVPRFRVIYDFDAANRNRCNEDFPGNQEDFDRCQKKRYEMLNAACSKVAFTAYPDCVQKFIDENIKHAQGNP